ncbi:MAG: LacI family DNA-binding transcriptional regulator, partial [Verrucomicrobiota bacterium]
MSKITLQNVADKAGVSAATVSRSLREDPNQASNTRKRIQKIAKEMGYEFNPMVSQTMSLVRRQRDSLQRGNLAYVNPCLYERELENSIRYFHGAKKRAKAYGYQVEHLWYNRQKMTGKRFHEILVARGIRGILVAPLYEFTETIDIRWNQFACVIYGLTLERPVLHRTTDDHAEGMHLALEKLREKGYRRIGFVTEERMEKQSRHIWLSVFYWDLQNRPRAERVPPLQIGMRSINQMKAWYEKHKPEVVICAGKANRFFLDLHKSKAGQPAFVTLEADLTNVPEASGVRQRAEEVGAIGVDLV